MPDVWAALVSERIRVSGSPHVDSGTPIIWSGRTDYLPDGNPTTAQEKKGSSVRPEPGPESNEDLPQTNASGPFMHAVFKYYEVSTVHNYASTANSCEQLRAGSQRAEKVKKSNLDLRGAIARPRVEWGAVTEDCKREGM
ncbi:hypothetical protein FB451DRAFT_1187575 [Mycena latifolia]|nr:hypothetical protein FB451DRAFT_1187575 [Mycena latifolia]